MARTPPPEVPLPSGRIVPVRCDHTDDLRVEAVFRRVREEAGRLDVLVNNVPRPLSLADV